MKLSIQKLFCLPGITVALGISLLPFSGRAQEPIRFVADSINHIVQTDMQRRHIPGVSVAVVRNGQVILTKGYGMANLELKVPASPQTAYSIGSVSKQFIATAILMLAEEGKLRLDESIRTYYPQAPDTWQGITLTHLLSHTSGLFREGPAFDPAKEQPDSVIVQSAFAIPLQFPTGSKWQYCNVGYFALADILRKVSGKSWQTFIRERIFDPAGMFASRTTSATDLIPDRADGYVWTQSRYVRAVPFRALRPSGAFVSTVLDLAKWEAALNTGQYFSVDSRERMWTPVRLTNGSTHPYGFGWMVDTLQGYRRIHHGGSLPGFRAEFARLPEAGLAVVVLTNADSAVPEAIAREILLYLLRSSANRPVSEKTGQSRR